MGDKFLKFINEEADLFRQGLFVGNPLYFEGLCFERYYAHKIIKSLSESFSVEIQNSFKQYFDYISLKRGRGFDYDKKLEKLIYKIELDWIRKEIPVAFKDSCESSSKIQKEIENDPNVIEYEFAA